MTRQLLAACALCALLTAACQPQPQGRPAEDNPCHSLDTLLQHLSAAQVALEEAAPWPECEALLMPMMDRLRHNMATDTGECNFLNMRKFPDIDRLLWVDLLRDRTETDTLPQGIYFLLHLRGIFAEDPDISEFFAEELAHVAHYNPDAFQRYLSRNPDQEVMLLFSTRWNTIDLDTLIARYARLDSAGPVAAHLREQKLKAEHGL